MKCWLGLIELENGGMTELLNIRKMSKKILKVKLVNEVKDI